MGVRIIRALLYGVYVRAADFGNSHMGSMARYVLAGQVVSTWIAGVPFTPLPRSQVNSHQLDCAALLERPWLSSVTPVILAELLGVSGLWRLPFQFRRRASRLQASCCRQLGWIQRWVPKGGQPTNEVLGIQWKL